MGMTPEDFCALVTNKGHAKQQKDVVRARALEFESKYKSKLEKRYAARLEILKLAGEILSWRYEPLGFRLAKNTYYYPDFLVITQDGIVELHETKGFVRATGRAKWKIAGDLYPEFRWLWVTFKNGHWRYQKYKE